MAERQQDQSQDQVAQDRDKRFKDADPDHEDRRYGAGYGDWEEDKADKAAPRKPAKP
ncbi:MAG: hypothetical protein R3C16_06990 [Hyphomonadaceae bacterium]